jgi:integrase
MTEEEKNTSPKKQPRKRGQRKGKPRRGHGEGAIYWREDRERWIAELPLEDGNSKYFSGKTYAEAQRKLNQAQLEQKQGRLATGPQQTVQRFLEHWLEVRKHQLGDNTYNNYQYYLKQHVFPTLGQLRLQQLSSRHIDELYAQKLKAGYAAETVRGIHRLLHSALEYAVKWRDVSVNVSDEAEPPRPVMYEAEVLTVEQATRLLASVKDKRYEALLTLAVTTGMREGELLGLKWADIDLEEPGLVVRRTVYRKKGLGIVEGEPKTETSKRKILLPQFALETLLRHRDLQRDMREKADSRWIEQDIVFSNRTGSFISVQHLRRAFREMLRKADLPIIRFHDLRHSAATILVGMGVHMKQIQNLLGHSSITITMDRYAKALPSMQREMMKQVDEVFSDAGASGAKQHIDLKIALIITQEEDENREVSAALVAGQAPRPMEALDHVLHDLEAYIIQVRGPEGGYKPDAQGYFTVRILYPTTLQKIAQVEAAVLQANCAVVSLHLKSRL